MRLFYGAEEPGGIESQFLREKKESIRDLRNREPAVISIGGLEFLLHPYGTASGYPILISNEDFKIDILRDIRQA